MKRPCVAFGSLALGGLLCLGVARKYWNGRTPSVAARAPLPSDELVAAREWLREAERSVHSMKGELASRALALLATSNSLTLALARQSALEQSNATLREDLTRRSTELSRGELATLTTDRDGLRQEVNQLRQALVEVSRRARAAEQKTALLRRTEVRTPEPLATNATLRGSIKTPPYPEPEVLSSTQAPPPQTPPAITATSPDPISAVVL